MTTNNDSNWQYGPPNVIQWQGQSITYMVVFLLKAVYVTYQILGPCRNNCLDYWKKSAHNRQQKGKGIVLNEKRPELYDMTTKCNV